MIKETQERPTGCTLTIPSFYSVKIVLIQSKLQLQLQSVPSRKEVGTLKTDIVVTKQARLALSSKNDPNINFFICPRRQEREQVTSEH